MKLFENANWTMFILCIIRYVIIKNYIHGIWKYINETECKKIVYEFRVTYTTQ